GQDGARHRTPYRRWKRVGLARLLLAVRPLPLGRRCGRWHQLGGQWDRDADRRFGRVRVDNRVHLLPSGPPRLGELTCPSEINLPQRNIGSSAWGCAPADASEGMSGGGLAGAQRALNLGLSGEQLCVSV